jgi:hypothetical protein
MDLRVVKGHLPLDMHGLASARWPEGLDQVVASDCSRGPNPETTAESDLVSVRLQEQPIYSSIATLVVVSC